MFDPVSRTLCIEHSVSARKGTKQLELGLIGYAPHIKKRLS